jgi:hypothetical protein
VAIQAPASARSRNWRPTVRSMSETCSARSTAPAVYAARPRPSNAVASPDSAVKDRTRRRSAPARPSSRGPGCPTGCGDQAVEAAGYRRAALLLGQKRSGLAGGDDVSPGRHKIGLVPSPFGRCLPKPGAIFSLRSVIDLAKGKSKVSGSNPLTLFRVFEPWRLPQTPAFAVPTGASNPQQPLLPRNSGLEPLAARLRSTRRQSPTAKRAGKDAPCRVCSSPTRCFFTASLPTAPQAWSCSWAW